MYTGSMYGAGVAVFAVWGYVISHTRRARVELNPKHLADTLGGTVEEIEEAIEFLMQPDPKSRNKMHEGRKLVKEGEFQYFLPSWDNYQRIRNADDRREYNRQKKREERARKKLAGKAGIGEATLAKLEKAGATQAELDKVEASQVIEPKCTHGHIAGECFKCMEADVAALPEPQTCTHGVALGEDCFDCRSDDEYRKENT